MKLDSTFYRKFADLCRQAARGLLDFEPEANNDASLLSLFRISHDLAGQAGLLDLERVCETAAFAASRLRGAELPKSARPALNACIARLLEAAAVNATGGNVDSELRDISRELTKLLG